MPNNTNGEVLRRLETHVDALSHVVLSRFLTRSMVLQIMKDPVVTALGYTYERSAITECVSLRACAHDWTAETHISLFFGREQVVFERTAS